MVFEAAGLFLWFDTLKSSLVWGLMWVCWTQALSVPLSHTEQRCFSFTWQSRLVRQKLFGFSSRTTCQRLALKLNYNSKDKPKVCEYSDKVVGHSQPLPTHCDTLSRGCLWVWLLPSHMQKYMSVNNGDMNPVCSFVTEQSPLMCWVGFGKISCWTSLLVVVFTQEGLGFLSRVLKCKAD